ncbi:MAG: SpoIID/LytB domain-containing protein, partial [Actinobacteria bacterium]|nr:SpoIID/LytB domain-containing protein [Actinomycetota bacterium]
MMRNPRRFLAALVGALFVVASACQPQTPPPPTSFTFVGGGFGHGVGMSQYGALGRAQAGHAAADILAAYFPNTVLEARSLGAIRVHLADANSAELVNPTGPILMTDPGGATAQLTAAGQALRVSQVGGVVATQNLATEVAATPRGAAVWFSSSGTETISLSATGKSYRHGRLQTTIANGKVRFVESDLAMEHYLYGLAEVPTSWPIEALKAQAIAGRSYAAIRLAAPKSSDFDIYSSTVDQVYSGTAVTDAGPSGAAWRTAVDQTAGLVLTHGGKVVQAYYSSSNGGHTELPAYVWSSSLPYLNATADPFDAVAANPNASWQRTYTADELGSWIAAAGYGNVGV